MNDQDLLNALVNAHRLISQLAKAMHDMLQREAAREERLARIEGEAAVRKAATR